ncbi:MAG: hypothetical protein Q8P93_01055 [bacterium]|nr:hypothetical protein [bacterium]
MKHEFPKEVAACLWSYDINQIDLKKRDHRIVLIKNVLNHGTMNAIIWLLQTFDTAELRQVITASSRSEWNEKSLALWSLFFSSTPSRKTRLV